MVHAAALDLPPVSSLKLECQPGRVMATRDIIVIGASAGGVQALTNLVADLPADLSGAVFIVLHIPAHIVVPANRHVRIRDGHVRLEADHADRPKPLVDMLFVECRAGLWRTPDRGDPDRFRLGWRRGRGRREGRRRCRHHSKSRNRSLSLDATFVAAHSSRSRG